MEKPGKSKQPKVSRVELRLLVDPQRPEKLVWSVRGTESRLEIEKLQ